ncbi:MAG: hypothetical protein LKF44_08315 [Atopobiaceae bacterium]|jgi:hypothetical protein|nr:hypothetical protein [Atopobiaceae bacterium]
MYSFASARDLFETARGAALENARWRDRQEDMRSRTEHVGGTSSDGGGGGWHDPNAASDSLMSFEEAHARMVEENERLMDYATAVLYGRHMDGGLASLLDCEHADVVCFHWVMACPWDETARNMHRSVRWCRYAADVAFDTMDGIECDRIIDGVGIATI